MAKRYTPELVVAAVEDKLVQEKLAGCCLLASAMAARFIPGARIIKGYHVNTGFGKLYALTHFWLECDDGAKRFDIANRVNDRLGLPQLPHKLCLEDELPHDADLVDRDTPEELAALQEMCESYKIIQECPLEFFKQCPYAWVRNFRPTASMPTAPMPEKLYCKAVHPVLLAQWKAEIDSLPRRKQDKWTVSAKDLHGTICKYRFVNGYFERNIHASIVKEVGQIKWPKDGWAPVIPLKTHPTFEQLERSYGEEATIRFFNCGSKETYHARQMFDEAGDAQTAEGLFMREMLTAGIIAENHTGNHYRNHHINVPTAAGEPVRG